jgi:hypothetical protein
MEWAHHPVTKEFLQELCDSKQETMEAWAMEKFTAATAEQTSVVNATAIGGVRVLDQLIEQISGYQEALDSGIELVQGAQHG